MDHAGDLRITSCKQVVHQLLAPRGRSRGRVLASMIAQSVGCSLAAHNLAWEAGGHTIRWCFQAETSPFEGPFGGLSDCCLPANLSRFGLQPSLEVVSAICAVNESPLADEGAQGGGELSGFLFRHPVAAVGVDLLGDVAAILRKERATSAPRPQLVPPPMASVGMATLSVRAWLSATSCAIAR